MFSSAAARQMEEMANRLIALGPGGQEGYCAAVNRWKELHNVGTDGWLAGYRAGMQDIVRGMHEVERKGEAVVKRVGSTQTSFSGKRYVIVSQEQAQDWSISLERALDLARPGQVIVEIVARHEVVPDARPVEVEENGHWYKVMGVVLIDGSLHYVIPNGAGGATRHIPMGAKVRGA